MAAARIDTFVAWLRAERPDPALVPLVAIAGSHFASDLTAELAGLAERGERVVDRGAPPARRAAAGANPVRVFVDVPARSRDTRTEAGATVRREAISAQRLLYVLSPWPSGRWVVAEVVGLWAR